MKDKTPTFRITWQVEDGYIGKDRPQSFKFNILDYVDSIEEWNELPVEERTNFLHDAVKEEFENKISYAITNDRGLLD